MKKKSLNVKSKTHKTVIEYLKDPKIFKVYKKFNKNLDIKSSFAVAVSGGPDSLSLAFLAKCFSFISKINVKFYLVDHKLRHNSSTEAKKVKTLLDKYGMKCNILTWHGIKPTSNIQANARNKRYYLLLKKAKEDKIKHLLLGHHVDDLYENFLIRLLRGSGLKGLTSFGKNSEYISSNIDILRPLINLEKKELIYIAQKVFKFFVSDPSNYKENFKRVRIRNLLRELEKEGLDKKKFQLTIDNLKKSDQVIRFYIQKNVNMNSNYYEKKNIFILNSLFFEQPHEVVLRSLSLVLKTISLRYYPPRGKSMNNLINKIQSNTILSKITLGGCFIEKFNKSILISRENSIKS